MKTLFYQAKQGELSTLSTELLTIDWKTCVYEKYILLSVDIGEGHDSLSVICIETPDQGKIGYRMILGGKRV